MFLPTPLPTQTKLFIKLLVQQQMIILVEQDLVVFSLLLNLVPLVIFQILQNQLHDATIYIYIHKNKYVNFDQNKEIVSILYSFLLILTSRTNGKAVIKPVVTINQPTYLPTAQP